MQKVFYIFKNTYLVILFLLIDQISKNFVINYLNKIPYRIKNINSSFDLVYVWNHGISFGILGGYDISNMVFFILNCIIVIYLLSLLFQSKNKLEIFAYNLIIGGAIGNLFDRVTRGGVFDFIHLHYKEYSFPIFNGADMFVSLGIYIIIYENIIRKKKDVA